MEIYQTSQKPISCQAISVSGHHCPFPIKTATLKPDSHLAQAHTIVSVKIHPVIQVMDTIVLYF